MKKHKKSTKEDTFPFRLFQLLSHAEKYKLEHVVSWMDNNTFKIHEKKQFTSCFLKRFFRHDHYKSFLRQLSMYKFRRIPDGPLRGSYIHPFFIKSNPELCRHVNRKTTFLAAHSSSTIYDPIHSARMPIHITLPSEMPMPLNNSNGYMVQKVPIEPDILNEIVKTFRTKPNVVNDRTTARADTIQIENASH